MSYAETRNPAAPVSMVTTWDKTFARSDKVDHRKVTFENRYGITLVGDLYIPRNSGDQKLAAIAVSGPFGAVKEQSSGLYAQTLAEQGFVTLAFDPSYTGESGGQPRNVASPDINTEDFSAAVDFLGLQKEVDRNRIGILGICGWGGMALNAASMDTRVKAVATSVMYDPHPVLKEFYDYYRMPRGFHARSVNSTGAWTATMPLSFMNMPLLSYAGEITIPTLIVTGENAHSRYFAEDAFKAVGSKQKELVIVPGANHVDLYDNVAGKIPFAQFGQFFKTSLN